MRRCFLISAAVPVAALFFASAAHGQTMVQSTYMTINVTGDPSQFASVPVAASNTPDANAPIDPVQLKLCNDSTYLYMQVSYSPAVNPQSGSGLFMAIDSDNNPSTGFAVYGSSEIGSNAGFENDYPFTQTASSFNSGGSLTSVTATTTGDPIYAASGFDTVDTEQMIAIPLDLTETDTSTGGFNGLVFPEGTPFTLEFYTSPSSGDAVVLGAVTYELATPADVPEPASLGLLSCGGLLLVRRRRRALRRGACFSKPVPVAKPS
jgi:hypothetical protein